MYWANLETRSFSFDTFGNSEDEARELMRQAWQEHKKDMGRDAQWLYEWWELEDSVVVTFVRIGDALRDKEVLFSGNTPKKGR